MAAYTIRLICTMITCIPIYVLARIILLRRRARRLGAKAGVKKAKLEFNKLRELCLGLFVIFMIALFVFVWQGTLRPPMEALRFARFRIRTGDGINFVPFRTVLDYYYTFGVRGDLFGVNILGNILIFVPWGFGLLLLWKKNRNLLRLAAFSLSLPIFIEAVQLFIGRSVDIDDVLLNFLGGMLGGLLYFLLAKIFPKLKTIVL